MTAALSSILTVEQVPLDQLRPDPANPRRISDDELDSLERSLRQFGFVQPVLARREDQVVIGGHQRLVTARRLGLTTVSVTWHSPAIELATSPSTRSQAAGTSNSWPDSWSTWRSAPRST
jgi:hypothetical protein